MAFFQLFRAELLSEMESCADLVKAEKIRGNGDLRNPMELITRQAHETKNALRRGSIANWLKR